MHNFLKRTLVGFGLGICALSASASPCDGSEIDIINQTSRDMQMITSEGYLETSITPITVGDIVPAHGERTVTVRSGVGTNGDAKGLLAFRNQNTTDKHRFISISFDFRNKVWLTCNKHAEVLNTLSDDFKVYTLPGYKSNVKVYIVE